ncbi:MAG: NADH-quinone oxidoreductase subunit NuoK [Bdellovibrionaceae bacterium]|nr:NADH-quinone oxidoreductase subunit NuoK [Pseudobdellovibrionaceae bacterium]MDW8189373.1 NADH-quinone oxidoreductase subunit NuoK [Pseudobdellovibrionaceae bacterium]
MKGLELFTTVTYAHFLFLSFVLFALGVLGVLLRRNLIVVMMSVELMLNAVNLTFITFAKALNQLDGQIFVFFVMTIAAAEAAVGLAIVVAIFKRFREVNIRFFQFLKG